MENRFREKVKIKFKLQLILIFFVIIGFILSLGNTVKAQVWATARDKNFTDGLWMYIQPAGAPDKTWFDRAHFTNTTINSVSQGWLTAPNAYCIQHPNAINSSTYMGRIQFDLRPNSNSVNDLDYGKELRLDEPYAPAQYIAYVLAQGATGPRDHSADHIQHIIWKDFDWLLTEMKRDGLYAGSIITSQEGADPRGYPEYLEADAFYNYKLAYTAPSVVNTNITVDGTKDPNYYFIGPLKIKYTEGSYNGQMFGGPDSAGMAVYDKNGAVIDWGIYWKIVDSPSSNIELEYPKNNTNFYLRISKSAFEGTNPKDGVGRMTIKMWDMDAMANFYVIRPYPAGIDSQQWIFLSHAQTMWEESTLTININKDIEVNGNVKLTKKDKDKGTTLSGFGFKLKNTSTGEWVKRSENTISYVTSENSATIFTTGGKDGTFTVNGLKVGDYVAKEVSVGDNDGYLVPTGNSANTSFEIKAGETTPVTVTNTYQKGDFELEKVDADNQSIKLQDVEFTLYCTSGSQKGKYVGLRNGEPYYSTSKVTLKTDSKGKISITGLWTGTYRLEEVNNPHYGYETSASSTITISTRNKTTKKITNKRKYIKVSGYVWEDKQYDDGKLTMRNDLYKDIADDKNDKLVSGIKVTLYEGTKEVKSTTTNANGEYQFTDVEVSKLSNYNIEFEYDGLIYESVVEHFDKDNGSKAGEGARQEFNNRFAEIVKGDSESQVVANSTSTEEDPRVNYGFTEQDGGRNAEIESTENCTITASTKDAGYTIQYDKTSGEEEVTNINLGIYERAQADLALQNQLEEVKVEIAGYGHIYKYGQNYDENDQEAADDSWNVGVRFQNPYKNVYKRAVYKSDANYENAENPSEELQMSLTYKITIANQSTLTTKVNKIVDYFDSRFELEAIGTGVDGATGEITGKLAENQYRELNGTYTGKNGENHTKLEIDVNKLISSSAEDTPASKKTQEAIYIQFNLPREVIVELLNKGVNDGDDGDATLQQELQQLERDGDSLQNKAEISSFTTYADAQGTVLYAAVDIDSVPDNCTLSDESTYEDDTDKASSLAIVIANAREVTGTIFEDLQDETLSETRNISEGDSQFDPENENTIGGVKVQLVDEEGNQVKVFDEKQENADGTTGAWTDANVEAESDTNGEYTISGFIPGRYKIKFIWGDGTYKIVDGTKGDEYESMIENYKSTVIDQDRYGEISNNDKFYRETKDENQKNNTYAIDDIEKRKEIDEPYKEYSYKSNTEETEMESYTPTLEINIEYNDDDLTSITYERVTERVAFTIDSINFGIIRRPKQTVEFVKTLCDIKFTLANGQVLIEAHIDENGNITGSKPYISYVAPERKNGLITKNGFLKIEIDSSLLQGSTVELKYQLRTSNTSQSDYIDDAYGYYQFGESYYESDTTGARKNADVLKISPTAIVDYLDETTVFEPDDETNINYRWTPITITEMERQELVEDNVIASLKGETYETTDINGNPVNTNEDIGEKQIYTTDYFKYKGIEFKPEYMVGEEVHEPEGGDLYMVVSKVINSEDDANFQNQAEIIGIDKNIGGEAEFTPGNYIPNAVNKEMDDSATVETSIVPSTGENRAYILPITILVVAFVLLGVGIYLIIVKIMKKQ